MNINYMETLDSIPFSSVIASMLLYQREVHSFEIVNAISQLNRNNILVEDEWDCSDELFLCVERDHDYNFRLIHGLDYSSILYGNITVYEYLLFHTSPRILSLMGYSYSPDIFLSKVDKVSSIKFSFFPHRKKKFVPKF